MRLLQAIARLLRYSFKDIAYEYDKLTEEEKRLVTREEFEEIRVFILNNL